MNGVTTSPAPSGLAPDRTAEMVAAVLWFVDRLVGQMFHRMARDPRQDVAMAMQRYLRGCGRRFAAVMTKLAAGGVFRTRKSRAGEVRGERTAPRVRLPGGFGWVVRLGEEVRASAAMIAHHLNTPEVAATVAGCPQAQFVLRRMCWVLAIDAPRVGRAVRGRRAKSVPVARPSPRPSPRNRGEGEVRRTAALVPLLIRSAAQARKRGRGGSGRRKTSLSHCLVVRLFLGCDGAMVGLGLAPRFAGLPWIASAVPHDDGPCGREGGVKNPRGVIFFPCMSITLQL